MSKNESKAYAELEARLKFYDKAFPFIKELAEWNATTDSFYDTFDGFRQRAKEIVKCS